MVGFTGHDSQAILISIGSVMVIGSVVLWMALGKSRITLHSDGATRTTMFGSTEMRWDEVTDYRYRSIPVSAGGHGGLIGALVLGALAKNNTGAANQWFKLQTRDGRSLAITTNWRDVDAAIEFAVERVHAHGAADLIARLASGTPVELGPISLTADAIASGNKSVPFSEVKSVVLGGGRLAVKKNGKMLAAFSVASSKVPNVFALLDALRARGVDVQDARLGATVVSTKGYVVPKR